MTSRPEPFQDDREADSELVSELKQAKERQTKLEEALYQSFPIELYKQARPDVEASCKGEYKKIIEQYIEHDINEIDFSKERHKKKLGLYEHLKKATTLLATELRRSRNREKDLKEENVRHSGTATATAKTTQSCLKILNLRQHSQS